MKYFPKLLFAFVVFLLSYNVDAQVGIKFCGQYKYNMIEDATNCYNYGGSMFITKDIKDIKLQVGLSYQSKNFQKEIRYEAKNQKAHYQLQYVSFIPIVAHFKLINRESFYYSVYGGFSLNDIVQYTICKVENGEIIANYPNAGQGLSSSCRLGFSFSTTKGNINLSCSPFAEYKIIVDSKDDYEYSHELYPEPYKTIPQDRWSFGLTIGVEYIFINTK